VDEIENPYRWPVRGALVTTLIGALGLAVTVVPHYPNLLVSNGLFGGAIIAGTTFLLIVGMPGLAFLLWLGYEAKKETADLLAANHLLHWRYAPGEWRGFAEAEWARAKAKVWRVPLIILCGSLVMGLLITMALSLLLLMGVIDFPIVHQIPLANVLLILGSEDLLFTAMVGTVLGVVFGAEECLKVRERYRRSLKWPGEAYLGHLGFYMAGEYFALRGRSRLSPARLEPGEAAVLRLNIEVPFLQRYLPIREIRVPIPHGREEEARELVERLSAQPYIGRAQDKPWSPSNLGFLAFLLLNLAVVLFYVHLPQYISPRHGWGGQFWVACLLFASFFLSWPRSTKFLKWVAVLGVVCFGLIAAILQFAPSAHFKHVAAATIVLGSLAQITSFVLLALEIRAWKVQVKKD
jgi:hypothetical protein